MSKMAASKFWAQKGGLGNRAFGEKGSKLKEAYENINRV